jgi:hypothetical protein
MVDSLREGGMERERGGKEEEGRERERTLSTYQQTSFI